MSILAQNMADLTQPSRMGLRGRRTPRLDRSCVCQGSEVVGRVKITADATTSLYMSVDV
ncbi:hypothetical protein DPMN_022410 [Dreissena polymorpha]|uniref:Uncharacterized protein n=1 Tax=Dreissena polymorpha TaxID=45954 RepID=A0A9D4NQ77_DREPO|nr:hypothetical protein DPMN_100941 [Dreissena polymorpha]KAH3858320.1 hypothetical protein DPMN_100943 [Dreissena polymorpha]KAH3898189.1 hypothetical protein DPMN_022410 [Dreissena polymorpha]